MKSKITISLLCLNSLYLLIFPYIVTFLSSFDRYSIEIVYIMLLAINLRINNN
jgi:hypothetical protein